MIKLFNLLENITPNDINLILKQTEKEQDLVVPNWEKFTPEICNSGFCDIFANILAKKYPGSEIWSSEDHDGNTFGHVWIKYQDKFYDAETPNGVNDWKQIPWSQRFYKKFNRYPKSIEIY